MPTATTEELFLAQERLIDFIRIADSIAQQLDFGDSNGARDNLTDRDSVEE
jgi:hypothetical protein